MNTNTTPNAPSSEAIAQAVRDVCETDPANPDDPDTLKISVQHLTQILEDHFGSAREIAAQGVEGSGSPIQNRLMNLKGFFAYNSPEWNTIHEAAHALDSPPQVADALDGERYRFLRKNCTDGFMRARGFSINCDEPESEWDAAIDAAIAARAEMGGES